ncbi:Hpt domain-containing protein [Thiothrix unzii]|jgi:HPt (histidine-containing phosphotransfer) domain-containing protein|uniref:Hpt domain-containing protein n=1 Tax=Thiothrix unzii TaxID=111769 RepID=UPI002A362055|nr:Hpt domain-containing protein [Thiothrix unzii]MDX9988340.1 Hpt domain-containing protein [Thiothrix unzii]
MQLLTPETLRSLPAVILPKLISLFSSTTPPLLTEIRQHATQGEWQAMAQAAHKLKGSCVSLGAEPMANICKSLQHKGEANDASGVDEEITTLTALYPLTLAALQAM